MKEYYIIHGYYDNDPGKFEIHWKEFSKERAIEKFKETEQKEKISKEKWGIPQMTLKLFKVPLIDITEEIK